jgi:hypothetical protein
MDPAPDASTKNRAWPRKMRGHRSKVRIRPLHAQRLPSNLVWRGVSRSKSKQIRDSPAEDFTFPVGPLTVQPVLPNPVAVLYRCRNQLSI